MKLFLLTQYENSGYDTYDSCVVCAENKDDAITITPTGEVFMAGEERRYAAWATTLSQIDCEEIGIANDNQKRGVIISSFNAG